MSRSPRQAQPDALRGEGMNKANRDATKALYSVKFSRGLSEIMEALDMSQVDLANQTGLTQAAVSQILNGKREPTLSTIVKILRVIPVKFEKLVGPL